MVMKVLVGVSILALAPLGAAAADLPQPVKTALLETYGKIPLSFEPNAGQADPQVKFLSRGRGYTLFLTSTEAVLVLREGGRVHSVAASPAAKPERGKALPGTVLRMRLVGANRAPVVAGVGELPGKSNYFVGNDPKKWRASVPTYAKAEYRGIYPGVNLVYYGNQRQLEYDFVVSPGADPRAITLAFEGTDGAAIDALGDLVLRVDGGEVRLRKPLVYQEHDGQRAVIPTRYVIKAERQVAFDVTAYDTTQPLIIDPVLAYSTYLGGTGDDFGAGIALDSAGSAYVTGETDSLNFPIQGASQPTFGGGLFGGGDAFVTKLNPAGTGLAYSTYLGGSDGDVGFAIVVDTAGNAYVTGRTDSADFPTTSGAFQPTPPGGRDAFVTKLNPAGSALVYSTYLGGSRGEDFGEVGHGLAVDGLGNAYVTGRTGSADFPTTPAPGGFVSECGSGFSIDAFVTKLNAAGAALVYSTCLGYSDFDEGFAIAVDAAGHAYVTGFAEARDSEASFPTTDGAFQPPSRGGADAFVTKLNPAGSDRVYSILLGGSGGDVGSGIVVDAAGNAYVTGSTGSDDFPTLGAFQPTFAGGVPFVGGDAFVTKLNPAGSALVYSTFLGGSGADAGRGVVVDTAGNAYITGETDSTDFPMLDVVQPGFGGGLSDAFVTKLNPAGSALVYSTYLGGVGDDGGSDIAVDVDGNAYVTGTTNSSALESVTNDFPTTSGAFQPTFRGGRTDAFVTKIGFNTPAGTNVMVLLGDPPGQVTVTFANVTVPGDTTVGVITDPTDPPPPTGFELGDPPTYYELTTTAEFSGLVTICISYAGITFGDEANLKLSRFEDPNWVDATPVSLDTTANTICGRVTSLSPFAIFEPVEPAIQPFAAFRAKVEIEEERDERELEIEATFTLGNGSDGIDPRTDVVILQVGTFSTTIPSDSFRLDRRGRFKFEGVIAGVALEVVIRALGSGRFELKAEAEGAVLTGTTNPVEVTHTIGNDGGSTMARFKLDD